MRRAALVLAALAVPVAVAVPAFSAGGPPGRPTPAKPLVATPVVPCRVEAVAAGDFDGTPAQIAATGRVAVAEDPDVAMLLGDMSYPDGTDAQLRAGIGSSPWTTLFSRAAVVPGNHDYHTAGAADYFAYFDPPGYPAGPGAGHYYSFALGCGWRGYALDSEITGDPAYKTLWDQQLAWLTSDLAAHPSDKVVLIWHTPRYSSGKHGDNAVVGPLWNALAGRTAVVLNGHDHDYERFAVKNGVQEFVVGTGGSAERTIGNVSSGSQYRLFQVPGVLVLTLADTMYWWQYRTVDGRTLDPGGRATASPFF